MSLNPYGKDWKDADGSFLPTNQLPLLRSMLGRPLISIYRIIPDFSFEKEMYSQGDYFRKASGRMIFELEGLEPICFNNSKYGADEISIDVGLESPKFKSKEHPWWRHFTLNDREYVDDNLYSLIGQKIFRMRILIRRPQFPRYKARALQDGIEMVFDNGATIIISFYLNTGQYRLFQILYLEEIAWQAVEYTVDVSSGRVPWRYRFHRWKWRAIDRLERRLGLT